MGVEFEFELQLDFSELSLLGLDVNAVAVHEEIRASLPDCIRVGGVGGVYQLKPWDDGLSRALFMNEFDLERMTLIKLGRVSQRENDSQKGYTYAFLPLLLVEESCRNGRADLEGQAQWVAETLLESRSPAWVRPTGHASPWIAFGERLERLRERIDERRCQIGCV